MSIYHIKISNDYWKDFKVDGQATIGTIRISEGDIHLKHIKLK